MKSRIGLRLIIFTLSVFFICICATFPSRGLTQTSSGPTGMSCCDTRNNFASFVADEDFASLHPSPLPIQARVRGGVITFDVDGGAKGQAYRVNGLHPSDRCILMFHEWWGLNDYIKLEADKLSKELGDVNVLAIDLYDGKVGSTPEEAGALVKGVNPDRLEAIIKGAIRHLGPQTQIATIGWCFGGGWALRASLLAGEQGTGTVMYYGDPVLDAKQLKTLNGPVLGLFAKKDGWIDQNRVKAFQSAMKQAGRKLEVHSYDADHGFANPSNPKHNPSATKDAHERAIKFFTKYVMQE